MHCLVPAQLVGYMTVACALERCGVETKEMVMAPPGPLRGKAALVTGGARGLGRAFALRLARLGAAVAIADVDLQSARAYPEEGMAGTVDEEIRDLGGRSLGIIADVTQPADCAAAVEHVLRTFGGLDILVNNAGGHLVPADRSWASTMPDDDLDAMLRLNLKGAISCSQAASASMRQRRSGKIINVGSVVGLRTSSGQAAHYSIAKAALHHYTRLLAAELGPYGVTVNCLAPGWILTPRTLAGGRARPETRARLEANTALRRLGTPEDCARVLEFLATELSDYVTGQIIAVDGGERGIAVL